MANYNTLKSAIQSVIKTNGNNEITGALLQQSLLSMINSLGAGYQFVGVATPSTNPGTPDQKVFYLAATPGEYPNFGGIEVQYLAVLKYNSTWTKNEISTPFGRVGTIAKYLGYDQTGGERTTRTYHFNSEATINDLGIYILRIKHRNEAASPTVQLGNSNIPYKPLYYKGAQATASNTWVDEATLIMWYDNAADVVQTWPLDWNAEILHTITKIEYTEGYYIANGVLYANANYRTSSFIPVNPGDELINNCAHNICFYDANKAYISGSQTTGASVTVPNGAYYLRFSSQIPADNLYFARAGKMPIGVDHVTEDVILFYNAIKSIGYTITDGAYYTTNGTLYSSASYSYTGQIKVVAGKTYNIRNGRRCVKFDRMGNFLGYSDNLSTITIPDDVAYIAFDMETANKAGFSFTFNALEDSIYVNRDELTQDTPLKIDATLAVSEPNVECISGTPGQAGAQFQIPIKCTGKYALSFQFKLPRGIQAAGNAVQIASLYAHDVKGTEGGFLVKIVPGAPVAAAPYQQVAFKGGISFYPSGRTNNNYRCDYVPNCIEDKPFVSNDLFSIRYKGDLSQSANRDVAYEITNTGLRIYHTGSGAALLTENFPSNKDYATFVASMRTKCAAGGAYANIIEWEDYVTSIISTDDIIRVSAIPMCGNYTGYATPGWDAFPCYVAAIDTDWHTLDIRFNNAGNALGNNGNNLMAFILDGKDMAYIDKGMGLVGTGEFENWLTLGGEGIEIRNFSYDGTTTRTKTPKIITYYGHDMVDSLIGASGTVNFSTGCLQTLIELHNRYGWTFIDAAMLRDYLNGHVDNLPEKSWTIFQDDQFFMTMETDAAKIFDTTYRRNNMHTAFAMIDQSYTGDNIDKAEKCRMAQQMYRFVVHSDTEYAKYPYQTIKEDLAAQYAAFKANIGDCNMFILPGGSHNMNTSHFLRANGIAYCGTVDAAYCAKRYYATVQPRISVNDQSQSVAGIENRLKWFDSI